MMNKVEIEIKLDKLRKKYNHHEMVSNAGKLNLNGSFGKLNSKWSKLYSPETLIQVTLTGQLCLLMLIERLEQSGISVVSANTDGICIKTHKSNRNKLESICSKWESETNFKLEETGYKSIHFRDVNSYIAIKENGKAKRKGAYANPGLAKNPTTTICTDAVCEYLINKTPIEKTILDCQDITKFVSVRNVKGGGVKLWGSEINTTDIEYLGKVVRWYYAKDVPGEIVYAKSGNKVALSEKAKPLMRLPDRLPDDIDYDWYIEESNKILEELGLSSCNNETTVI